MTHKRTNKLPSFDTQSCVVAVVSGCICGYALLPGRVPPLFHVVAFLDLYVAVTFALWCIVRWAVPRLRTFWHGLHVYAHHEAERIALSEMIARRILEATRLEHQGRDTCYLICRDEDHHLVLLSPDDPEYAEVARALVGVAPQMASLFKETDDASSHRPDDNDSDDENPLAVGNH